VDQWHGRAVSGAGTQVPSYLTTASICASTSGLRCGSRDSRQMPECDWSRPIVPPPVVEWTVRVPQADPGAKAVGSNSIAAAADAFAFSHCRPRTSSAGAVRPAIAAMVPERRTCWSSVRADGEEQRARKDHLAPQTPQMLSAQRFDFGSQYCLHRRMQPLRCGGSRAVDLTAHDAPWPLGKRTHGSRG